jgi:cardiolipin synthase
MGHFSDVSTALCKEDPNSCVSVAGDVCYLSSGDAFFDRLKEDCEQAKSYIFLEFFIIDRGIMWDELREILCRKVKEGVEVRLIYDDIGSMSRVRSGYYKYLRKLGIKCVKFAPFVPVVTNVHNNRDHRKIAVIDGQVAYTGGINIADEYINVIKPFGVWKDSAVRLTGDAVRSLTLMFLQTYDYCTRKAEDFSPYLTHPVEREEDVELAKERGLVQVYGAGPSPIYSRSVGEDVYLNLINSAKKYIYITSPYLIIDYRLKEALVRAAMRGVDVRIVTPHIPDKRIPFALTRSNYRPLMSGGVKIYEYAEGFVHGKNMLVDDTIGVVGSINLDYRSFLHHFECAALLYGVSALGDLKKDFEETFQTAIEQGEHTVKQNAFSRLVCEVAKIFAPLF